MSSNVISNDLVQKENQTNTHEIKVDLTEETNETSMTLKQENQATNSNAISVLKPRRYKITVMYSDEQSNKPLNQNKTPMEVRH